VGQPTVKDKPMQYTVIGVWRDDKPVVTGVVVGHHEVYGGDEEIFTDGLWFAHVAATDVTAAEQLAKTEASENAL
jgi:hypothetical protein